MRYQINQPNPPDWSEQIDVSDLDGLLEQFMWRERMVQTSIEQLNINKEPKVLNLGGFRIDIVSTEEAAVFRSLEYVLRNFTDKNKIKGVMQLCRSIMRGFSRKRISKLKNF